ncbi:hypothetical protein PENSPDRAFT_685053 [Peniophora sp. CONT]|nr:hypothetical protein PENSPDRAFT_685053 [Peniophora sp. CONT]
MARSLRRTHTFADVRRAQHDDLYYHLSLMGFNLPGPVNTGSMNNAIAGQAPPPSPTNATMNLPMEIDTSVFVVGAAVPAVPAPSKAAKKLRAHSSLPYDRPLPPAMRNKDSKKKSQRRVSFKSELETISEENEAPRAVQRSASFTEMFKKMCVSGQ